MAEIHDMTDFQRGLGLGILITVMMITAGVIGFDLGVQSVKPCAAVEVTK